MSVQRVHFISFTHKTSGKNFYVLPYFEGNPRIQFVFEPDNTKENIKVMKKFIKYYDAFKNNKDLRNAFTVDGPRLFGLGNWKINLVSPSGRLLQYCIEDKKLHELPNNLDVLQSFNIF